MNITWKSEYNIGNYTIDSEHQKLFSIANRAMNIKNKDEKSADLKSIIKELYAYTSMHFINEEKYMNSIEYPELTSHKKLHSELLDSLNKIVLNFNNLTLDEIHTDLNSFIYEYFVNHIITQDKRIELYNVSLDELQQRFGWRDIYKVENELIDSEHQKLFELANEAFKVVEPSKRNEKIKDIITRLYNYMKTHFSHEEEYMEKIGYPDIKEHKLRHKEMTKQMNTFVGKLPSMDIESFEKELASLIDIVLLQHIVQEDTKLARFAEKTN